MNEPGKYSDHYRAEDIQRYLEGKMDPAEMHALEKAALDDPFLADAIEGMQGSREAYGANIIDANLQQLKEQLAEKTKQTGRVIPLRANRWWQVAAAAIILVTGGVFAYNAFVKDKGANELALDDQKKNEVTMDQKATTGDSSISPTIDADEALPTDNNDIAKAGETGVKPPTSKDKNHELSPNANPSSSLAETKKAKPDLSLKEDKSGAGETQPGKDVAGVAAADSDKLEKNAEANKSQDDLAKKDEAAKSSAQRSITSSAGTLNYFQGRVTDNNNKPVANASVQMNNQKQAVVTDDNGYFKIPSQDTAVQVLVNSAGFETKQFQLSNRIAYNEIRLEPATENLNEVVIKPDNDTKSAGARTNKSKNNYPKVMVQDAEPVMGWVEFEQYLEKNKKPAASTKKGEVVVSFQVNRKGNLSDYKVEQSLSVSQDAEAIRLIKEGPPWQLKQGRRARVMVIVRF